MAPPVAVVNQTFARRVIGTTDAIGRRFRCRGRLLEIVGVVEDGKYRTLTETPQLAMFVPLDQQYESSILLLARSPRPAPELAAEMRRVITGIDPQVPVYGEGSLRMMLGPNAVYELEAAEHRFYVKNPDYPDRDSCCANLGAGRHAGGPRQSHHGAHLHGLSRRGNVGWFQQEFERLGPNHYHDDRERPFHLRRRLRDGSGLSFHLPGAELTQGQYQ